MRCSLQAPHIPGPWYKSRGSACPPHTSQSGLLLFLTHTSQTGDETQEKNKQPSGAINTLHLQLCFLTEERGCIEVPLYSSSVHLCILVRSSLPTSSAVILWVELEWEAVCGFTCARTYITFSGPGSELCQHASQNPLGFQESLVWWSGCLHLIRIQWDADWGRNGVVSTAGMSRSKKKKKKYLFSSHGWMSEVQGFVSGQLLAGPSPDCAAQMKLGLSFVLSGLNPSGPSLKSPCDPLVSGTIPSFLPKLLKPPFFP